MGWGPNQDQEPYRGVYMLPADPREGDIHTEDDGTIKKVWQRVGREWVEIEHLDRRASPKDKTP